jgi:sec-independent protein translocase protein TatB
VLDIGFTELALIAGVGLVVLGPQRLPVVTRTVGALLGRAQRYVADVKNDIQRQMDLEELRKAQRAVSDIGQSIQSSVSSVEQEVQGVTQGLADGLGSDADFASPFDRRAGLFMGAPERTWSEEQNDQRVRDRVRNRLRRRYLTKKPRHD